MIFPALRARSWRRTFRSCAFERGHGRVVLEARHARRDDIRQEVDDLIPERPEHCDEDTSQLERRGCVVGVRDVTRGAYREARAEQARRVRLCRSSRWPSKSERTTCTGCSARVEMAVAGHGSCALTSTTWARHSTMDDYESVLFVAREAYVYKVRAYAAALCTTGAEHDATRPDTAQELERGLPRC